MRYFLGVDTGATKSHALIADEQGRAVGFAQGSAGNWEVVGWQSADVVLTGIVTQAIASAGITPDQIAGAGFGLAGYDWPEDHDSHIAMIESLNLKAPFALVNDAMIGLVSGASKGWGVGLVAGTSCNCYGRTADGRIGRSVGSSRFGDLAGSWEIVHKALQEIGRAWSQQGPSTALTQAFVDRIGAEDIEDLLAGFMRYRYKPSPIYAPLIFEVAHQGDPVAREIVRWAGQGLGKMANGVIRQLDLADKLFEVVLAGSFFNGSPLVAEIATYTIHDLAPHAQIVRLKAPPCGWWRVIRYGKSRLRYGDPTSVFIRYRSSGYARHFVLKEMK